MRMGIDERVRDMKDEDKVREYRKNKKAAQNLQHLLNKSEARISNYSIPRRDHEIVDGSYRFVPEKNAWKEAIPPKVNSSHPHYSSSRYTQNRSSTPSPQASKQIPVWMHAVAGIIIVVIIIAAIRFIT